MISACELCEKIKKEEILKALKEQQEKEEREILKALKEQQEKEERIVKTIMLCEEKLTPRFENVKTRTFFFDDFLMRIDWKNDTFELLIKVSEWENSERYGYPSKIRHHYITNEKYDLTIFKRYFENYGYNVNLESKKLISYEEYRSDRPHGWKNRYNYPTFSINCDF